MLIPSSIRGYYAHYTYIVIMHVNNFIILFVLEKGSNHCIHDVYLFIHI
jgi:hypothetical protein